MSFRLPSSSLVRSQKCWTLRQQRVETKKQKLVQLLHLSMRRCEYMSFVVRGRWRVRWNNLSQAQKSNVCVLYLQLMSVHNRFENTFISFISFLSYSRPQLIWEYLHFLLLQPPTLTNPLHWWTMKPKLHWMRIQRNQQVWSFWNEHAIMMRSWFETNKRQGQFACRASE